MWNSREAPHERCCYGNCGMHVGRYLVYVGLDCGIMSQDGRNAYPWHRLLNQRVHKMRCCCDWRGWSVQKLEPIERLNIGRPNMVKRGLMYLKQNWKWMLTRLWKNENIGLATPKNRTGASAVEGRDHNHHATYQWCVRNYSYFYIPVWAEDTVKLSSKEIDKNGKENQTKPRWVWSGRHNQNRKGCGKRKQWEKVLWRGGK